MRYLTVLLFILSSCVQPAKQEEQVSEPEEPTQLSKSLASEPKTDNCDSIHAIGLKEYSDFEELNQSSTSQIRFDQLDSEQQNLVKAGICQLRTKVTNSQYGELLRFPIAGGCLRGLVGIQDYSNNAIAENEIADLATKTFDDELVNLILKANETTAGLYVDEESNAVSGLTFTVNETTGEDEFGEIQFSRFYVFQRFSDGFFLTAVMCAG